MLKYLIEIIGVVLAGGFIGVIGLITIAIIYCKHNGEDEEHDDLLER